MKYQGRSEFKLKGCINAKNKNNDLIAFVSNL